MSYKSYKDQRLAELQEAIERGLEECGLVAEGHAKAGAPVDTGRLRNSITHQQIDDHTEGIGTNVEYAIFQELGTSRGVKPKHYLKNSVFNHKDEYKNILQEEIGAK